MTTSQAAAQPSRLTQKLARLTSRAINILVFFVLPVLVVVLPALGLIVPYDEQHIGLGTFHVVSMLEGGVLTLSLTLVLFAALSRRWLYILFAGWLIGNLRITALSMGWDMQWLGQSISPDYLEPVRKLTCAVYYLLTFALFVELFNNSLARLNLAWLLRLGILPGLVLLLAVPILSYPEFAHLMWWMASIGVAIAVIIIGRLLSTAYTNDILWYSTAILIVIAAGSGAFDALDHIFNSKIFSNAYIHVVATAISSGLIALVITESDRTSRAKTMNALVSLAEHDPLTNTLNQRGIEKHTQAALHALRHGEPFALGYVDLASLKTVNDIYGHTAGDTVLRQVCTRIGDKLAANHYLGRIGGSELVLLLRNTSIDDAHTLALAIMDDLQATPCHIGPRTLQLKTSMGLVEIDNPTLASSEAILAAARACRMARRGKPNQIVVHEYADQALAEQSQELQLLREFSSGFSPHNMFLVMQPILSLQDPVQTFDFEILLRMRDSAGKLIPTSTVIAAAEEVGVATMLDKWIVQTALEWLHLNQAKLANTRFICLNLNGMSLNDPAFIQGFFQLLRNYQHVARLLCIEITESVALKDMDNIQEFINQLHGMGVRVALDDFGAGYTSFSYLKQLPADMLKIDGSFIQSVMAGPADIAIVEAIVAVARNLGMKSLAEWVEDAKTLETLADLGVDYVQGYAIARPQSPEALLHFQCSADFIEDTATRAFVLGHLEKIARASTPDL